MSNFNRFGAAYTDILQHFTTAENAVTVDDFGGLANIEFTLDQCEHEIIQALPERVMATLTDPALEMVCRRAAEGQTTVTLSFLPVVSGSVSIWTGQPLQFVLQPKRRTDAGVAYDVGDYSPGYGPGYAIELPAADFSTNLTTGVVTLVTPLSADDQVYASYQVDVTSSSYTIASLKTLLINGATASLGFDFYNRASITRDTVRHRQNTYETELAAMQSGAWIIPELRRARWWQEITPTANTGGGSVRLHRG